MSTSARIQPKNAAEVRNQLHDVNRHVSRDWLTTGDRGDAVADLQRRLRSFGVYDGKATGVFDQKTLAAVKQFQKQHNLVQDGAVGPQTAGALTRSTLFVDDNFEGAPAEKGQRGGDIKRAERLLKDQGYDVGAVDGHFSQKTAEAVRAYRKDHPQLVEGQRMTAKTFAALRSDAATPLSRGTDDRAVRVVEANLKRLGLMKADADNRYTKATEDAVRAFQRQAGLPATGIADQATRSALQKKVDALPPPASSTLERFDTTPPKSDYTRTTVDGKAVNKRTAEMLQRVEFIMDKKFGHKNFNVSVTQGSYNAGGVAASAGTHDGGGALDIHTRTLPKKTVDDLVKAFRMAGFAAWSRGRGHDSFDPHIHAIAIGDRQASAGAKQQVQEYFNGGDGLVGSNPDPDRGLGRPVPRWARRFDQ